ncbi:hypothetical protein KAH94_00375 [bacterium]|nr:hypothetical protein [bacterium]
MKILKKIGKILLFVFITFKAQADIDVAKIAIDSQKCHFDVVKIVDNHPKVAVGLIAGMTAGVVIYKYDVVPKVILWCKWQKIKYDTRKIAKAFLQGKGDIKQVVALAQRFRRIMQNRLIKQKVKNFFAELKTHKDSKVKKFVNLLESIVMFSGKIKDFIVTAGQRAVIISRDISDLIAAFLAK